MKNEFVNNDFFQASTLGVVAQGFSSPTTPTPPTTGTDLSSMQDVVITLAAGQEVVLIATNWPGKGNASWKPDIVLDFSSNGAAIPALQLSWLLNGATQTASIAAGSWWSRVNAIPDAPNDNGTYTIRLKAQTAGSFKVKLTNG